MGPNVFDKQFYFVLSTKNLSKFVVSPKYTLVYLNKILNQIKPDS